MKKNSTGMRKLGSRLNDAPSRTWPGRSDGLKLVGRSVGQSVCLFVRLFVCLFVCVCVRVLARKSLVGNAL